ncbi:MAG: PIN domain-containing protein [Oscillospiraceae bacterium]|nr:PIN domain-containing protein [Oscillospiraceae bacterium]
MIYALDTNIISYILRDDKDVKARWLQEERTGNQVIIPLIVYYEVLHFAHIENLTVTNWAT